MATNDLPAGTARPVTTAAAPDERGPDERGPDERGPDERGYVDWAAILAGAALAAAISLSILSFGSALGLGITSPLPGEGVALFWFSIAAGLWLLWVQVSSFMVGGYLAGRLRRRVEGASEEEVDMRDGSHGSMVWAVGTRVGAVMPASGVMGAARTAADAAGARSAEPWQPRRHAPGEARRRGHAPLDPLALGRSAHLDHHHRAPVLRQRARKAKKAGAWRHRPFAFVSAADRSLSRR